MRCEDAIEQIRAAGSHHGDELRAARTHASGCDECQAALSALEAVRTLRNAPAPVPGDGAIERAIDKALHHGSAHRYRRGYWIGVASGAALAATVAAVAVGLWLARAGIDAPQAIPEVRVALHRAQDVTVTLESPESLANAEVRVELRGAVALEGYDGQRELRWSTNLERGINQLTLPVVALDAAGGQLLVEVAHGTKRRTFVLDVRAAAPG